MALILKYLGQQPYLDTWQAMQDFTQHRTPNTPDEIWLLEHPPTFTQGLNGQDSHILHPFSDIPLIKTDRGGQITYHAPGQLIAYILIDLKRLNMSVRNCVHHLEEAIIDCLTTYQITSQANPKAPGVYVNQKKIASLGIKVKKKGTYHGLALNINMDLTPFERVNPCGLIDMKMTQMQEYSPGLAVSDVAKTLGQCLTQKFNPPTRQHPL